MSKGPDIFVFFFHRTAILALCMGYVLSLETLLTRGYASEVEKQFSELLKMRDPFKEPTIVALKKDSTISDLEKFPVHEFKLLAVSTGPTKYRALVKAPNDKTYVIGLKAKVGTKEGVVIKINEDSILIREKLINALGQEDPNDIILKLDDDKKIGYNVQRNSK